MTVNETAGTEGGARNRWEALSEAAAWAEDELRKPPGTWETWGGEALAHVCLEKALRAFRGLADGDTQGQAVRRFLLCLLAASYHRTESLDHAKD